jgi:heavy metal sensor kinase
MIRSLRVRLLLSTSLSIAIVLGLLGLAIYFSMRRSLQAEFDRSLMAQARALAALTEQNGDDVSLEFDPEQLPEFTTTNRPEYFQAWLENGQVLTRSSSLGTRDLAKTDARTSGSFQDMLLPNNHHGRSVSLTFFPRVESSTVKPIPNHARAVTLLVARETSVLHHTLEELRGWLWALFAAAVVVSGAALVFIVGRAMIPVDRLAQEIEGLAETTLSNHLASTDVPSELLPVVEKLNGLFDRLSQAFAREKAFTADVAHELRTPLAGLQTTLEVCRSRSRDATAYETTLDKCRSMTDRMQAMIENLLLLARAEAGQLVLDRKSVDLCLLLTECWALLQHQADRRHLSVQWQMPENCLVQTDREKLSIVIQNLFDNAIAYCDEGGSISISCGVEDGGWFAEIANSGSQVSSENATHLFERFWRGDASRSGTGSHYGLGLSLCQRLMKVLKGQINIQTVQGRMFIVRVWLP